MSMNKNFDRVRSAFDISELSQEDLSDLHLIAQTRATLMGMVYKLRARKSGMFAQDTFEAESVLIKWQEQSQLYAEEIVKRKKESLDGNQSEDQYEDE